MPERQDAQEGWLVKFPSERQGAYAQGNEGCEMGPWVDVLHDREKTTYRSVSLTVDYKANNPVTITWYADREELARMTDRVRVSSTTLKLKRNWFENHHESTYKVTVKDQGITSRHGANPVSSSCTIIVDIE